MYNPIIPYASYTNFTPALPEFYWNVYSAEQRIKHICFELCKMHAYADYLAEQMDLLGEDVQIELKKMQDELEKSMQNYHDEMIRLINELQEGVLQWNVQHGEFTGTIEAQRDMFNDVTVHSYNVAQLENVFDVINMDVDGLANCGLNVKGFALINHVLRNPNGITEDMMYHSSRDDRFTVNDLHSSYIDSDGYVYVDS